MACPNAFYLILPKKIVWKKNLGKKIGLGITKKDFGKKIGLGITTKKFGKKIGLGITKILKYFNGCLNIWMT